MTLTEILDEVETAPDDQLRLIRRRLVAATALVDARLAEVEPVKLEPGPTGDMSADEVVADLGLNKRAR